MTAIALPQSRILDELDVGLRDHDLAIDLLLHLTRQQTGVAEGQVPASRRPDDGLEGPAGLEVDDRASALARLDLPDVQTGPNEKIIMTARTTAMLVTKVPLRRL
jgi:hypothetical protein